MKKNLLFLIGAFTLVFYFFANASEVFAQSPAAGSPKPGATAPPPVKQETQEIVFGAFKNYRHSSGWFSMSVPENWNITDKSNDDEYIISILDPSENAAFIGRIWSSTTKLSDDDLEYILTTFLNDNLSDFDNFKLGSPVKTNGKVSINFTYDSVMDKKIYPMIGESFIEQNGQVVGLTNFILPKDQSVRKKALVNRMINSITINPGN